MDKPNLPFLPGLELSRQLYQSAVGPLLAREIPRLPYSAALIGYGSDVIGMDTAMSRDHMWGPRMILFLPEDGYAQNAALINSILRKGLPREIAGYPTSFGPPDAEGVRLPVMSGSGPVDHLIDLTTIPRFFDRELGSGRWQRPSLAHWLTFSEHRLLTLTTGAVFHDDLGLETVRQTLAYYPRDAWLYLIASTWNAIGQEEPFVGRTGVVGDDLGSRLVAARLARACMYLGFLYARRYAPYSKWFGAAFARLELAPRLKPHLERALAAADWQQREAALCGAYETLAEALNHLEIAPAVETRCSAFHNRPFRVIHGEQIAATVRARIEDPALRATRLYGSVNLFSPSTDLLEDTPALEKLSALYP